MKRIIFFLTLTMLSFSMEAQNVNRDFVAKIMAYTNGIGREAVDSLGKHIVDIAILQPRDVAGMESFKTLSSFLTDSIGEDFMTVTSDSKDISEENGCKILLVPATDSISLRDLSFIEQFFKRGGRVLFSAELPDNMAETSENEQIQQKYSRMMMLHSNPLGGIIDVLNGFNVSELKKSLSEYSLVPDVRFQKGKALNYLHLVKNGKPIYCFTNRNSAAFRGNVIIRGFHNLRKLNLKTYKREALTISQSQKYSQKYTLVSLLLKPGETAILVSTM